MVWPRGQVAGYMRIDGLVGAMARKCFKHQSLAVPEFPQAVSAVHAGPKEGNPQQGLTWVGQEQLRVDLRRAWRTTITSVHDGIHLG